MMFSDCVPRYSGMRAPADVGEQAGGTAVAHLVLGLVDAEGGKASAPVQSASSWAWVTERARSSASSSDAEISGSERCSSGDSSE